MRIQLQMLGLPRLSIDGRIVPIAWQRRTLALLSYLFTSPGAQPRDGVAFALWPDDDEETARSQLRRNLNALRGQLPRDAADWIAVEGASLEFRRSAVDTDVTAFETAIDRDGDLAAAVQLYGGDFAASADEPHVLVERERLRARFHAALTELTGIEFSARRFERALAYGRRILTDEPFREDIVRRMISIHYAMGDRPGALSEFDRFARSLRVEMGIDPMPETAALRDLVLRGEALPVAPDARLRPAPPARAATAGLLPFTGRRTALEVLERAWASACDGKGKVIFVGGEAGVGKTRTVAEFLDRTVGTSGRILRGSTASPEARPYEALLAAFGQAAHFIPALEIDSVWLAELTELVPEIGSRSPRRARTPLPAEREATRLFESFARFAVAVARGRATVIVLEDLHWAQAASFDALRFLATRLRNEPILLIGTYRTGDNPSTAAVVHDLCSAQLADAFGLSRLTTAETLDLLKRTTPPIDDERAHRIARSSEGHPLFLGELVRDDAEARHEPAGGIAEVVAGRLRRCSPGAQHLARVAAVCGETFDLDLLGQAAGWDDGTLVDRLAELLARQFIRSTAAYERGGYAFSHALVHAAVLESLEARERAVIHRIAARVLESRHGAVTYDLEIARHWAGAGDPGRAARAYARAARSSLAAHARDEAASLAARGLALSVDPSIRRELLEIRIAANLRRASQDVLRADVGLLRETVAHLDDDAAFAAALLAFNVEEVIGDTASRRAAVEALQRYDDGDDTSARRAWIAAAKARYDVQREHFAQAFAGAQDAAARFAACGNTAQELRTSIFLARLMARQGRFDEAAAFVARVESRVTALDDPALAIDYWYVRGVIPADRRDPAATLHAAARLGALAAAAGDRLMEGHAALLRGIAHQHRSQLTQALRELDAAEDIYESIGAASTLLNARNNRASTLLQIGRVDEAAQIFAGLYDGARGAGADESRYYAASNLGCALLAAGRVEEALTLQREALAIARALSSDGQAALALGDLGAAETAAGESAMGLAHLREAIAINRRLERTAVLAHDLARAASAEGSPSEAAVHARGALALVEADPEGIALAPEILNRCGDAFARAGDWAASEFCRGRARELFVKRLEALEENDRGHYRSLAWHASLDEPRSVGVTG
jgi:DNA-binding SARP family transcriptional activator